MLNENCKEDVLGMMIQKDKLLSYCKKEKKIGNGAYDVVYKLIKFIHD